MIKYVCYETDQTYACEGCLDIQDREWFSGVENRVLRREDVLSQVICDQSSDTDFSVCWLRAGIEKLTVKQQSGAFESAGDRYKGNQVSAVQ